MNKKLLGISYLVMALNLGYPLSIQADLESSTREGASAGNTSTSTIDSHDAELAKKIHDKIGKGWFSRGYDKVKARVNNGVVTLIGSVETLKDKEKVEEKVREIEGVKKINNQIIVEEAHSKEKSKELNSTKNDEELDKKIQLSITQGTFKDDFKVVFVNISNGVVTLDGQVKNHEEEQKLIREIQKIEGVKSVNSNLKVQKS